MFLPSFASPTLDSLELQIPESEEQSVVQLLYSLVGTPMTRLRLFSFVTTDAEPSIRTALSEFLRRHSGLYEVEMIGFTTSGEMDLAIASMGRLRNLEQSFVFVDEEQFRKILLLLVDGCPMLQELHMRVLDKAPDPNSCIPFAAIRPLLKLPRLSLLSIDSTIRISLKSEMVVDMGHAWTEMRELDLCRNRQCKSIGSLRLLADFALAFPSTLTRLAIPFGIGPTASKIEALLHTFPSLKDLNLGHPNLKEGRIQEVAEFLAIVCPPEVDIKHSTVASAPHWEKVLALVAAFHRVHAQRNRAMKHWEDFHRDGELFKLPQGSIR